MIVSERQAKIEPKGATKVSEGRKRLSVISEFEKKELTDVFRLTLFYFKFEEKCYY